MASKKADARPCGAGENSFPKLSGQKLSVQWRQKKNTIAPQRDEHDPLDELLIDVRRGLKAIVSAIERYLESKKGTSDDDRH